MSTGAVDEQAFAEGALLDLALQASLKAVVKRKADKAIEAATTEHPSVTLAALVLATAKFATDRGMSRAELAAMIRGDA